MAIIKHLNHAHIYLNLARASAIMAEYHALKNPMHAMELDRQYVDFLAMARVHLNHAKKERKEYHGN